MSLQDKFESALAVLREHNEAVGGPDKPGYVDSEKFIVTLKATGATTEERLKGLRYEDILEYLPSTNGVKPLLLAKAIAAVFRDRDEPAVQNAPRPVSAKKADKMTPRELVESFDPENPQNAVGKILSAMSKGEPWIVYSTGRIHDVEASLTLLLEVKQGYKGRTDYTVNGAIKPVFRIGELPDNYADENPLYKNRPLRPDGTCDQLGRSWEGVPLEVRQLVRIAVETKEIEVTIDHAHTILDISLTDEAMKKLRNRYRKASVKFDDLAQTGNLPKLKIALGAAAATPQKEVKSPFEDGKKVVWAAPALPNQNYYRAFNSDDGDEAVADYKAWQLSAKNSQHGWRAR